MDRVPDLKMGAILTAALGGLGSPFYPPIFEDNFNRADAPTLGSDWGPTTPAQGGFAIVSNKAQPTGTGFNWNLLTGHTAVDADVSVTGTVDTNTLRTIGVAARWSGVTGYSAFIRWSSAGVYSLVVGRSASLTSVTTIASVSWLQAIEGIPSDIRLVIQGPKLTIYSGGIVRAVVQDNTYTTGNGIGILSNNLLNQIDSFTMADLRNL